ncbi:MAG: hypothetical protein C0444_09540 [Microbacterium sp.]|nr:hypothetical protein [Microbacterium sp.]MBA4346551.1 hypothetical protein [Microbacterium sp.]
MTRGLAVGVGAGVAIDELDRVSRALQSAAEHCHEVVVRIPPLRTGASRGRDADLWEIEGAIVRSRDQLSELSRALRTAASLYESTERAAARSIELIASQCAAAAALVVSRLGLLVLPGLVVAASRVTAVASLMPEHARELVSDHLEAALAALLPALREPAVLEAIRVALTLADDAVLGTVGVPPGVVAALGEAGLDVTGIDSSALAVVGLAALAGVNGVDPVRVDRAGSDLRRGGETRPVAPPDSLADRVGRVPDAATPVTIERYTLADGSDHVEVYIAGTDAHAPMGGEQPWDMASNIALIAGSEASSVQAVRAALAAEGVTSATSIVFTGYSQGGAIATMLAESGDYRTTGLVTVGAPSGALPVRGDYPAIVIEHRDDLVPVLSGIRRETTAVVVRGDAVTPGEHVEGALPAHDLARYLRTAAQADAHDSVALRAAIDALPQVPQSGTASAYTATRIPSSPS